MSKTNIFHRKLVFSYVRYTSMPTRKGGERHIHSANLISLQFTKRSFISSMWLVIFLFIILFSLGILWTHLSSSNNSRKMSDATSMSVNKYRNQTESEHRTCSTMNIEQSCRWQGIKRKWKIEPMNGIERRQENNSHQRQTANKTDKSNYLIEAVEKKSHKIRALERKFESWFVRCRGRICLLRSFYLQLVCNKSSN